MARRRIAPWLTLGGLLAVGAGAGLVTLPSVEQYLGAPVVGDGDSLTLNGVRIRLVGIDAPELDQTCGEPTTAYSCGQEARRHLIRLIGGLPVLCESRRRDRYDRVLAHCTAGGRDLNAMMVRDGWAVSYGKAYLAEEDMARARHEGLWSGGFARPQEWRRARRSDMDSGLDVGEGTDYPE